MISFPLYLVPKRISASDFTAPDNSPSAEQLPVMAGINDLGGRGKHRYVRMFNKRKGEATSEVHESKIHWDYCFF